MIRKKEVLHAGLAISILAIIIVSVSYFSVQQKRIIGPLLMIIGFASILPLLIYKVPLKMVWGDAIFGLIDNGVLAIFAITGAEFFGVLGAIVGSLVGNAITDGIAGIFEGYEWQRMELHKDGHHRGILSVAIGKLSGCLVGGGLILTIAWTILGL